MSWLGSWGVPVSLCLVLGCPPQYWGVPSTALAGDSSKPLVGLQGLQKSEC